METNPGLDCLKMLIIKNEELKDNTSPGFVKFE